MSDDGDPKCVFCRRAIRPGDLCHYGGGSADGEIACEACAPTWADIREPGMWCDLETGEPATPDQAEAAIAEYIASGGKLTDKIVERYEG